jgi:hypothetical protein
MNRAMEFPEDAHWVAVNAEGRIHPYGMHRMVNRRDVEVTASVSTDSNNPRRWVLVRDGGYEVWVMQRYQSEYGYELQPDEQVSTAEFDAITLKQRAIEDGESVTLEEVSKFADSDDPPALKHALIAAYYVAQTHEAVSDSDVDQLRKKLREKTGYVDLRHKPTVLEILRNHFDGVYPHETQTDRESIRE